MQIQSFQKLYLKKDFAAGVYRLEISCVDLVMLVFSTQLCDLCFTLLPLSPSLWFIHPPRYVNKYTVYTYTVWKGEGGMGFWASHR
jgi:hypothetical protein